MTVRDAKLVQYDAKVVQKDAKVRPKDAKFVQYDGAFRHISKTLKSASLFRVWSTGNINLGLNWVRFWLRQFVVRCS